MNCVQIIPDTNKVDYLIRGLISYSQLTKINRLSTEIYPLDNVFNIRLELNIRTINTDVGANMQETRNIPSIYQIREIIFDDDACFAFLFARGAFLRERNCHRCNSEMKLGEDLRAWRCNKKGCGGKASVFKGSFFTRVNIGCSTVMLLAYLWLNKTPVTSMIAMSGCSSRTVCAFNVHFRELVTDSLDMEDCKIGGPGIIVEIDETKLGKRKYHMGHRIEGVWVLGGIERTLEKKVFMTTVANRTGPLLLHELNKYILPGSIVYSDMWRGYAGLENELNMQHETVNHSVEFVSEAGVHTNTIEATWCGLKLLIPKRNRTKSVENHLWEYVWRKRHSGSLWESFIDALGDIIYE